MFAKPISLILVYIVTIFNVIILASPLLSAVIPFIDFEYNTLIIGETIYHRVKFVLLLLMFIVSFLMILYLALDFLLGFSLRSSLKGCKRYEKYKEFDFLTDIFTQVKDKFGARSVRLYIKESDEVNAFAVSSMGRRAIVLTRGMINHYMVECEDGQDFLYAIRSIMGHEMSHLVNKDFLPSFLIISNQKVTNFASGILYFILSIMAKIASFLPYGRQSSNFMYGSYTIINFAVTAFNRFVVYNIYELLRRFISRSIEYRCDRQSAKAFGGKNMAFALSLLGDNGYFTLFSTHPRTKTRMKKVENIEISPKIIRAGFFDWLSNYLALMFLAITCLYFAKQAKIDLMVREYIKDQDKFHQKALTFWGLISQLF